MTPSQRKLVIGCAACAVVAIYGFVFFKAEPEPGTAGTPSPAPTLRILFPARDGIFLVYDAAIPREDPDQDPRFLAYWRDYNDQTSYVF